MKEQFKRLLTERLFLVFILFGMVLLKVEGVFLTQNLNDTLWGSALGSRGNVLIWILLLISIGIYLILCFMKKPTHLVVSLIHVSILISYLVLPFLGLLFWIEEQLLYVVLNVACLLLNVSYPIYLHLKSKELPEDDILDS